MAKKYIDADRLKAEIERRIEETKSMKPSFDQFLAGQISAFKGVKTIIASLQQEIWKQMEVLNEAVETFAGYNDYPAIKSLYEDLQKLKEE